MKKKLLELIRMILILFIIILTRGPIFVRICRLIKSCVMVW